MEAKTFCWYGIAKSPTVGEVTGLICGKSCKETGKHDVNEWTIVISVWTMLLLFFLKTNQRNFLWYFLFRIAWPQELRSLFLGGTCFELFCWSSKSKFQESKHEFFQRNMTPYQGCCWSNCRSSWSWTWRATTFARRGAIKKPGCLIIVLICCVYIYNELWTYHIAI
jgi:hypothetical protein